MEGWRLKRGDLLLEHKSDIEIWMHFNYFFSEQSKKRNTYKYGLLKSILDSLTLCNSASNYSLDFDVVFEKFTKNYWTIVLKYQLFQMRPDGKSHLSKIESILLSFRERVCNNLFVEFDSLQIEVQRDIVSQVKKECKKYVLGALYADFEGILYGFDLLTEKMVFNPHILDFMFAHKHTLEIVNYYYWAKFIESIYANSQTINLLQKLELATPKRMDLSEYKRILLAHSENVCFFCGKQLQASNCHIDHFIPWSFMHEDSLWNLVLSCPECNRSKSNKIIKNLLEKVLERNRIFLAISDLNVSMSSYSEEDYLKLFSFAINQGFKVV